MAHRISTLNQLKESPQWILIPRRRGNILFIVILAITLLLSLVPLVIYSILP